MPYRVLAGHLDDVASTAGTTAAFVLTAAGTAADGGGSTAFWLAIIAAISAAAVQILSMVLKHRRDTDRDRLRHENDRLRWQIEVLQRNHRAGAPDQPEGPP